MQDKETVMSKTCYSELLPSLSKKITLKDFAVIFLNIENPTVSRL
jgi:hypothetical protein